MKPEELIKTHNTDAMEWAKSFKETILENNFDLETIIDESYMVGWFANAIMTMYDKSGEQDVQIR